MTQPFIHLLKTPFKNSRVINTGQYNGYVNLPIGHPWFGKNYAEINVSVHGGLTFSQETGSFWTIGFDTCHGGDTFDYWTFDRVHEEAANLLQQCLEVNPW